MADSLHENYDTICERVGALKTRGEIGHVRIEGALLKSGSPRECSVINDLRDTVDPMVEVALRNKMAVSVINYINNHYKIRTGLVVRHTGYTGLNPDKLPDLFRPPTTTEKQNLMSQNESYIVKLLSEFPEGKARDIIEKKVRTRIWKALSKYDADQVQPQHFVMMVARRAIYEHFMEQSKAIGVKRRWAWKVGPSPKGKTPAELSDAQRAVLDDAIKANTEAMEELVRGRFTGEEGHDIVQNAILKAYSGFDPKKHENADKFLLDCVRSAIHDYCSELVGEKWTLLRVYYDAKSQLPHMQNRPKNTMLVSEQY